MPLNNKGHEIKTAMENHYGKAKGDEVFFASENSGKIKGVTARDSIETAESVSPMSSLPLTVSQAEIRERNRILWEQPGGSPPELTGR